MHTATWTPRGMVVFGGSTGGSSAFSGPDYFVRRQLRAVELLEAALAEKAERLKSR